MSGTSMEIRMDTRLNARQVAKSIIKYSNSIGAPISNLKLQKLLYYSWIENYKQKENFLFEDDFYSWQFGPVVPIVYFDYCAFGGFPIIEFVASQETVDLETELLIKHVVDKYKEYSALDMVKLSHEEGHAWDRVYQGGKGNRCLIRFDDIIRLECN